MPTATDEHTPSLSRRDALRFGGAAVAIAGAAVAVRPAGLIEICRKIVALDDEADQLAEIHFASEADRAAAIDRNCDEWERAMTQAAALPARNLEEIRARAAALGTHVFADLHKHAVTTSQGETAMWKALARDLLAA